MKIAKLVILLFVVLGIVVVFLLAVAAVAVAQTTAPRSGAAASAHIPYDFLVEDSRLPAGDYTLSWILETVVLIRNEKGNAEEQAFLLPVGQQVELRPHELIFVVHNGQHYLSEVWNSDGRAVITSQFDLPLAAGDTESQVQLVEQERDENQQPSSRQQLQHIHTPQSIDQELARLTKDLELTPEQQQQVRPLLEEHHDKIQALLGKNPAASRQELEPQIHAISDETHRKIHALLTDHQKELEQAMRQREHNGEENRRHPGPASPDPPPPVY